MGSSPIIYKMLPKLNWNRKNIGNLILFHEFFHIKKPQSKIKSDQFNVKWFFNRFLYSYYGRNPINMIENRLDLILFRTNWFKSYNHIIHLFLTHKIYLNNLIIPHKNIYPQKGDIIQVKGDIWLKKLKNKKNQDYLYWLKIKNNYLLKNPKYLEINNNIKSFIIIASPHFKNIPYPRNLCKLYKDEIS